MVSLIKLLLDTEDLPGDLAEFGVFEGGTALRMAEVCPHKLLHLFDTWDIGTPWDDEPPGIVKKGSYAASLAQVKDRLRPYNVYYHAGVFPDTTKGLETVRYSLVHLDPDVYLSVKYGIHYFWPRMVKGGVMVFDDWDWPECPGVNKAILERFSYRDVRTLTNYQCFIRKP